MEDKKTVTIKDSKIWDAYQKVTRLYSSYDDQLVLLRGFAEEINYYQEYEVNLDEVLNVCEAILHGDEVKLKEPKYALAVPDDEHFLVNISKSDQGIFLSYMNMRFFRTENDWKNIFRNSGISQDMFVKVHVDD